MVCFQQGQNQYLGMANKILVGVDIGGSLTKIAVLSQQPIGEIQGFTKTVHLNNQEYRLLIKSFSNLTDSCQFLKESVVSSGKVALALTGGGALLHKAKFQELVPGTEVLAVDEFEANVKGVELIRRTRMPINVTYYQSSLPGQVQVKEQQTTIDSCKLPILFVSLGSGANFSKYEMGENGLERVKAQDPYDSEDGGCFLAGTSLGAGYLAGLSQLVTGIKNTQQVFQRVEKDQQLEQLFKLFFTNIAQSAINQSLIHNTSTVFYGGSVVGNRHHHKIGFAQAMKLNLHGHPLNLALVTMAQHPGIQGSLGAVYHAFTKQ